MRYLIGLCAVLVGTLAASAAPVPATSAAELRKQQDSDWEDLAKDERAATRALLRFAQRPDDTVKYFKEKLKPLKLDAERARKLILDLGSEKPEEWKPAFEEFQYLDPRLALSLQETFDATVPGIGRQRLVAILMSNEKPDAFEGADVKLRPTGPDAYNFVIGNSSYWAECKVSRLAQGGGWQQKKSWVRAIRAVTLLEHFGSTGAIEILQAMSGGHAEATPTVQAKESLAKLRPAAAK